MFDISSVLNKEKITGDDVGKVLLYNDINKYRRQIKKDDSSCCKNLITQAQINSLIEKIDNVEDADILECYVQLRNFIKYSQAISYAYNQQAQNGFCRLLMYMTQAQQVEHARKTLETLPMIMTESQFLETSFFGPVARQRGVAIVANNFPCRPGCLDVNDYFIEPELDCFQEMMSLEHAEELEDKIEYFRSGLMLDGLKKQTAYNKFFELVAERLNIPEFTVFCTDSSEIESQINDFNIQRDEMENEIAGDGTEFENRKRILNKIFKPIDISNIQPKTENINKVREKLKDISVFRSSLDKLVNILLDDGENNGI